MIRPFALERYFAKHEFSTRYLLGSSDPESMSIKELLSFEPELQDKLNDVWLGYTESLGSPELRKDIAAHYNKITANEILLFTGAEEPIYTFMQVALKPGDHLIVHFPGYQSHYSIAQSRGIEVSYWHAEPQDNWRPDLNKLATLIKPETSAILICTPHNPTGYLFSKNEWHQIINMARKIGAYLFCDEVYRGSEHQPENRLPNMADEYENGISLNCLSKNCGLAGLRTGWIATQNKELYNRMASFKDYLTICNCAASEFLAAIAVRNMNKLFEIQRTRLKQNLELLQKFFLRYQNLFTWQPPVAGTTTFPAYNGKSALEFCEQLVEEAGILLIPGNFFDMSGEYLRFGYGRNSFKEALNKLDSYLSKNPVSSK